jgi:hypothetical protein
VLEHHDEKVSYRGSADRLTLVAFYADCHHAVRPVTAGYRVALTYNLFLEGAKQRVPKRPIGRQLDTSSTSCAYTLCVEGMSDRRRSDRC